MKSKWVIFCLPLVLASSLTLASPEDLWLHVYVQEGGEQGETVRVNVPMSLIEAVLPLIEHEHLKDGKLMLLDEIKAEGIDIRQMWEAVRDTPDGEFVRVEGPDENVRVMKSEGFLLVKAEEDDERVSVRFPLDVVDALFSGEEGVLDIAAAIRTLGKYKGQDMVVVEEDDSLVRVWIDDRQEMQP